MTDDPPSGHWPGEPAVWSLLASDAVVFSIMFIAFVHDRAFNVGLFQASHGALTQLFGLLNTALLLISSWFVAAAVHSAKAGRSTAVSPLLYGAVACGIGFVAIKCLEYWQKYEDGIGPNTSLYFTYYFTMTGIHLVHVLIGIGVISLLSLRYRNGVVHDKNIVLLESGASFWHLVDLLWIVLFTLFYLVK